MNDCTSCGRKIKLRSLTIRFNGKRGCAHWLEADGEKCICLKEWCWTKWRADKSSPTITQEKIEQWDNQNDPTGDPRTPQYGVAP